MSHSIQLNESRCVGCTTCIKVCPTEAIRISYGKAVIYDRRCIDCGRCVSTCPHHAYSVRSDSFDQLEKYKYNIALPDSTLYGQFKNLDDLNLVNEGLILLGFDDVYPCAIGAEMLSDYYQGMEEEYLSADEILPRISSECPATARFIAMEYQDLIPNVVEKLCSFEVTAMVARKEAVEKTGLKPEEIGIGLISPCPAKNTRVYHPLGLEERVVDYVLPINDVYVHLLNPMKTIEQPRDLLRCGKKGMVWGRTGGQTDMFPTREALAVDSTKSVRTFLGELEDDKVSEAEFVELGLCTQSCFGGCLTVENPYTAKLRMRRIVAPLPEERLKMPQWLREKLDWDYELEEIDTEIADSISQALQIEAAAVRLLKTLPKFDCGNCGAPTCRAFARDVAEGFADEGDCIFNIIRAMREGRSHEEESDEFVPPPFRQRRNP
ncbi:MAG: [Fe-Fe] hydrogenase large subunit C-terminal domain-containing protein [Oscillospiraceae bacterium]|nr:[Fe-Fe] hydrogenase large subunit C-terminal domain-containing protein [Oscillospiraceae bacterium]